MKTFLKKGACGGHTGHDLLDEEQELVSNSRSYAKYKAGVDQALAELDATPYDDVMLDLL